MFDNLFHLVGPVGTAGILFALLTTVFTLFSVGRHFEGHTSAR